MIIDNLLQLLFDLPIICSVLALHYINFRGRQTSTPRLSDSLAILETYNDTNSIDEGDDSEYSQVESQSEISEAEVEN